MIPAAWFWYQLCLDKGMIWPSLFSHWSPSYVPPTLPQGLAALEDLPQDWRPNHRVVVSLSTIPHRLEKLRDTIDSLLIQSFLPDAIYVNIPLGVNQRTGQEYFVPTFIQDLERQRTPVRVLRGNDYGPATKLIPTLLAENQSDTLIITVDDDHTYHPHWLKTLVWHASTFLFSFLFFR
jgi:hypothetical protein